ncbi:uncharacterized protein LOC130898835 [Diorhabda carinulata]|nr:uncharacterized protein LOC130898835 [Diorhabda carinulata]
MKAVLHILLLITQIIMFKLSLVLCVVFAISEVKLAPNDFQKLQETTHEECLKEAGIEQVELTKVFESKASEEAFENYSYCFAKKFGVIGEDNKINKDKAREQFERVKPGSSEVFMKACVPDGEVSKKMALVMSKCIVQKKRELLNQ